MQKLKSGKFRNLLPILLLLFIVTLEADLAYGRMTYDRCSLAQEMDNMGVPRSELARWACIAKHESNYRTWVKGPPNTDGSIDYGIFQLNGRYWCHPTDGSTREENGCGINCERLLSDDISLSVRCARQILRESGWSAWTTWRFCNGNLRSIDDCFEYENSHFSCFGWKP